MSVSLSDTLVERLDALVDEGVFGSRTEALRYGARLVVREEAARGDGVIDSADSNPPADDSLPGRAGGGGRSARE